MSATSNGRTKPCKLAYRLTNNGPCRDTPEYAHLHLEIMIGNTCDASKEYDNQPDKYHLERLEQIRNEGDSVKYFSTSTFSESTLDLQWLTSRENYADHGSEWFACKVESGAFNAEIARLFSKLVKLTGSRRDDTTPANVLSALHSMGARRVRYARNVYSAWIFQSEPTVDDIKVPWPAREESSEEQSAVA